MTITEAQIQAAADEKIIEGMKEVLRDSSVWRDFTLQQVLKACNGDKIAKRWITTEGWHKVAAYAALLRERK